MNRRSMITTLSILAAGALPPAAVLIARASFPAGLSEARAASPAAKAVKLVEKSDAAKAWAPRTATTDPALLASVLEELRKPIGRSPLGLPLQPTVERSAPTPVTPPRAQPEIVQFRLTSISGGPRQTIAVIDGRVRREGDEIRPGWTLVSIDRAAQVALITGPSGQQMRLAMERN
jgi:hypothetical protein